MAISTRNELVSAPDGGELDAHAFVPSAPGPGILLLQEIYGFGDFLRAKATLLAGLGYAVLVPDVFWRVERNVSLPHDDDGLQVAFGYAERFAQIPAATTTGDLVAALEHLRALPEVDGKVGVLGYCLGGRLAYEVAAAGHPDACVAYYGSGIGDELASAKDITCPMLFHYGGADPYISRQEIDAVTAEFGGRPDAEIVVQEQAGHAFENSFAPMFSNPEAATASWPVTLAFLERTLRG